MKILESERLLLRTMAPDDAPFYLALVSDRTWISYMGDKGIRTQAAARAAIIRGPCAMQRRLGFSLYLVERKSDSVALGICGLIKRDALPDVDIGYGMLAPFRGHGYAHEAASAVMLHAEHALGLPRLLGITGTDNLASNNLLKKLGLCFEKRMLLLPDDKDCNLYRRDFIASSP